MASIICVPYENQFEDAWEDIVLETGRYPSVLSQRFLQYHKDRFNDQSLVFVDSESNYVHGVLPAAEHISDKKLVVSHPGTTFGGLLTRNSAPSSLWQMFIEAVHQFRNRGYSHFLYKPVPSIFSIQPDETDIRIGFSYGTPQRLDLWSVINLTTRFRFHQKRRASIKAALRKGVSIRIAESEVDWENFYSILLSTLQDRHGAKPVHSLHELLELNNRLGKGSTLWLAEDKDNALIAGTWIIDYGQNVWHTQYISSSPKGRSLSAVDALLAHVIDIAMKQQCRIFSFGINTQADGWSYNETLMKQKLRFGGGLVLHPHFNFDLDQLAPTLSSGQRLAHHTHPVHLSK